MSTVTVLWIPGRFDGLNEMINQARSNRYVAAKAKKEQTQRVEWFAKMAKVPKYEKAFISFRWMEPNMKRDPDNVVAARKFILDGLVEQGVLPNDGWKQVLGFRDDWAVNDEPGVLVQLDGELLK